MRIGSVQRKHSEGETLAVVPYLQQKPKNRIERKAFEDLEKIRRRREDIKKRSNLEQEKKKLVDEKKRQKLKKQIEMRKVQLGMS